MTIEEISHKYNLKENHIVISAIQRFDHELVYPVAADEFIMGGDRLYTIGSPKNILRCVNECGMQCPNLEGVLESAAMEDSEKTSKKGIVSTLILITMVVLSAFKVLPLLNCCLLAAVAMIITIIIFNYLGDVVMEYRRLD